MDYRNYSLSIKELLFVAFEALGISLGISFLFYRSFWGCLCGPLVFVFLTKHCEKKKGTLRRQQLEEQFMSGMQVLNTSLQAGLSMENAWKEVEKETLHVYGQEADFYREVKEINHSVSMNIPIERLVLLFAQRTGVDGILGFAEIFAYGKRSGGNWKKMIGTTVLRITEKYDAKKEIQVMLAGKQMEQQVMNIVPLGILAFLQFASWDYMKVLFHNPLGVGIMTICLAGYVVAIVLAQKILQIKV